MRLYALIRHTKIKNNEKNNIEKHCQNGSEDYWSSESLSGANRWKKEHPAKVWMIINVGGFSCF